MAAICAAVHVIGVATCCLPLAFFDNGWLGACAVVGIIGHIQVNVHYGSVHSAQVRLGL